jgi:hypothetical protein
MFILYAVLLGLVAGRLTGGGMERLARLRLRWSAAIAFGLVAQLALFSAPVAQYVGQLGPFLYVVSMIVVTAAVIRNAAIPGMPLVAAGALANLVAVVANGGFMPASPAALAAAGRVTPAVYSNTVVSSSPWFWPLTDIFALPSWMPLANVFSVGDVLIGSGIAVTLILAMRRPTAEGSVWLATRGAREH